MLPADSCGVKGRGLKYRRLDIGVATGVDLHLEPS